MNSRRIRNISERARQKRQIPVYLAIGLPLLAFIYVHLEMHILFHRVELGALQTSIEDRFGQPDRVEQSMLFCEDIFDWSGECPTTMEGDYYFYRTGIDRWVVIGFDQEGYTRFKAKGSL